MFPVGDGSRRVLLLNAYRGVLDSVCFSACGLALSFMVVFWVVCWFGACPCHGFCHGQFLFAGFAPSPTVGVVAKIVRKMVLVWVWFTPAKGSLVSFQSGQFAGC